MSEHYLKLRSHAKISVENQGSLISVENQNGHSLDLCNLVMKYNCLIAHATYTMSGRWARARDIMTIVKLDLHLSDSQ